MRTYAYRPVLSPAAKVAADRAAAALKLEQRARAVEYALRLQRTRAEALGIKVCSVCGTPISHPVSVERGIGPSCWAKHIDAG